MIPPFWFWGRGCDDDLPGWMPSWRDVASIAGIGLGLVVLECVALGLVGWWPW